jgi:hypothetical protein
MVEPGMQSRLRQSYLSPSWKKVQLVDSGPQSDAVKRYMSSRQWVAGVKRGMASSARAVIMAAAAVVIVTISRSGCFLDRVELDDDVLRATAIE